MNFEAGSYMDNDIDYEATKMLRYIYKTFKLFKVLEEKKRPIVLHQRFIGINIWSLHRG